MATFSKSLASCGGVIAGPADVIEYLRISSRPFMFTASGVPAAVGAALAAVRICRSAGGRRAVRPRARQRALPAPRPLRLGFAVVAPTTLADGSQIVTPVVPVVVGDDWKAVFLWKALYDAGVFVNVAIHPAVPPAGALLRTSVMATHDRATLDRALAIFAEVKREFEAEHGPLPGPGTPCPRRADPTDATAGPSAGRNLTLATRVRPNLLGAGARNRAMAAKIKVRSERMNGFVTLL